MERLFLVKGTSVEEVFQLDENNYVPVGAVFKFNSTEVFKYKNEAMYCKLLKELRHGKPLSNFKASKYYKYYLERLKKENPEYLI